MYKYPNDDTLECLLQIWRLLIWKICSAFQIKDIFINRRTHPQMYPIPRRNYNSVLLILVAIKVILYYEKVSKLLYTSIFEWAPPTKHPLIYVLPYNLHSAKMNNDVNKKKTHNDPRKGETLLISKFRECWTGFVLVCGILRAFVWIYRFETLTGNLYTSRLSAVVV